LRISLIQSVKEKTELSPLLLQALLARFIVG
jgi:hypothetical protein